MWYSELYSDTEEFLTETFAYSELYRLCKRAIDKRVVNEKLPCYSIYGEYELDFMMLDVNNKAYGIEVKGNPKSLAVYLDKKLIDRGIVANRTQGGHGKQFDTIPIYTVGARFPYEEG